MEKVRREKMQVREKVAKSRFTVFFQWSGAPKIARRCGAKHISKSKCTKHTSSGPLLEVATSKKWTPLWREAHFQVKMYKTHQLQTTFGSCDVEKVDAVVARSTFPSQMYKTRGVRTTFWRSDVEKVDAVVARSTCPSQKSAKNWGFWAFFDVQMWKTWTLTNLTNIN